MPQHRHSDSLKVTVIIPVYNAADTLLQALQSVQHQTLKDWEAVLVDDGSIDHSRDVAKRVVQQDERFRLLIFEQNQGIVAAVNHGLEQAAGEWVARFDADDLMQPQRLEKQLRFLETHPECLALGTGAEMFGETGQVGDLRPAICDTDIRKQLLASSALLHPTVMYRRRTVLEVGGYRSFFLDAEDYDLWLRLARVGQLSNLPDLLTRLRVHEQQVSHRKIYQQALSTLAARHVDQQIRKGFTDPTPDRGCASRDWLLSQGLAERYIAQSVSRSFAGRIGHLLNLGQVQQARNLESVGWEVVRSGDADSRAYQAGLDWAWGRYQLRHQSLAGAVKLARAMFREPTRLMKFLR